MAQNRRAPTTERQEVSISDFEREIKDLDGDCESKNFLVYGDSGCGKTVFAGTAQKSLILACEPGYISAARNTLDIVHSFPRKLREIRNSAVALAACDYLEAGGFKEYDWIVLEGGTTLETTVRLNYAAEAFDANPAKRAHRNLPDKPDYYNTQNFMRGFISRLVDLPVNLLITAHAMRMDDDSGDRLVLPAFQQRDGQLSNYISGLMHVVGFMKTRAIKDDNGVRYVKRMLTHQIQDPNTGTVYFAKDQFNLLPRTIDNPTIPQMMSYIDGQPAQPAKRAARNRR